MGLSLALNTARSSLLASSAQMAVVSRNTVGASDPAYSRKIATLIANGGAARVVVNRASDNALFFKMLGTTASAASQQAILDGFEKLSKTIGDTQLNQSPAARIGKLNAVLQQYAQKPDDLLLAKAALDAAKDLATGLNDATTAVQKVRQEADASIADSVRRVNDLLNRFDTVNKAVINGTASGADVSDQLDARDRILAQLSEEMAVTVVTREGNDMAIYTDSGVPLYEKVPRAVKFDPTSTFVAGTVGSAVFIDGVQVTGAGAPMPLHSGAIAGFVELRDKVAVSYQDQLDAIAKGLIEAFAESDQGPPPKLADATGLFTYPGAPALPGVADLKGLAGTIAISSRVDPEQGGKLDRFRDGGINLPEARYRYNPGADGTNLAFSDRLYGLSTALGAQRSFPASLGLGATASLQEFASSSASWVEGGRKAATTKMEYQTTLLGHASEALSNATGVNRDDETAFMLQLEKSYSASAKLISVIDDMLRTLLDAVR